MKTFLFLAALALLGYWWYQQYYKKPCGCGCGGAAKAPQVEPEPTSNPNPAPVPADYVAKNMEVFLGDEGAADDPQNQFGYE